MADTPHAGSATTTFTGAHGTNFYTRPHAGEATSTFTGAMTKTAPHRHVTHILTSYDFGNFSSGPDREDFRDAEKRLTDASQRDYKDEVR